MSTFAAEWLALREPHDADARNKIVLETALASVAHLPAVALVDLACGSGATVRAVGPHLGKRQNWRLVDNDLGLLARAAAMPRPAQIGIMSQPVDLVHDLEAALDGALDIVTVSALLDLVSEPWLDRLVTEVAARRLPIYASLTHDGRIALDFADPLDRTIIDAVRVHQRGDKGFGPALGAQAGAAAIAKFVALGYVVTQGLADWSIAPSADALQRELLAGWARAARDSGEVSRPDSVAWLSRRKALVKAGRSSMRVGHVDFFARPNGTR